MPSLLSPAISSNAATRSYTPLSDEVNPPSESAPSVTQNGAVLYPERASSSSSSSTSSGEREDGPDRLRVHRSESEETLSPGSFKGKEKAMNGYHTGYEEADVGEVRRAGMKGKEKQWDPERGDAPTGEGMAYPPLNETEEEERRIQENLARFAARDMARRRAARVSRQLSTPPNPNSPPSSSSTTGFMRRPFSLLSTASSGTEKRASGIFGLMDGIMGSGVRRAAHDGELPLTFSHDPNSYPDPYRTQPNLSPAPQRIVSQTSPAKSSPFADPIVVDSKDARRASLISTTSGASASPLHSPTETNGFAYGYAGPSWRGGAAASHPATVVGDKWWHALCAWGSDLDEEVENERSGQAGRTNPFE